MADEQIVTNIVATSDFSSLIADVQRTTSALTKLQQELSLSNKTLAAQAGQIQKSFGETLRSTGQFTTHFVTVGSEIDRFGKNLDAGKLKLKDYFSTWQQHTKTSGGLIRDLAKQQVALQNAIVQPLGKSADGLMKFNVHVANGLNETANKTALARKEMQIYNKVIQDGGVQLINWGKNTQWAGRQLTVGLTVPIAAFGAAAQKAFREADAELVRLTKVYGGLTATSATELAKVRKDVSATARELSAAYGSSYKDTIALAADLAATGKQGNELLQSTKEATRLSILGEVDRQDAMKATLAIQNAFKQNTDELSQSINFLNAVENQTSTSLADLTEAIPKAGPVIKSLGGSVQDLALYLTAMKEGGINASEGANAIKSSLASLINPTKVAKEMFAGFGIDLGGIVTENAGDLTGTLLALQKALNTLDPLSKSKAIEQLFGKFQFARLSALFDNLGKQGSQTLQVLDLMKASSEDLAGIAGRELSMVTESASGQYRRAIESLKADLAGLGEQFLKISTFFIKTVDGLVKFINNLPGPLKTVITLLAGFTALAGPLIMLTGVFANFIGYVIKGIGHMRALGRGGEGFKLLTPQILAAEHAGSLIEKTFYSDATAAGILKDALSNLTNELTILQQKAASGSISVQPTLSTIQGRIVAEGAQRVADPNNPLIGKPYTRQMSHLNPVAGMTTAERAAQTIFGVVPGPGPVNQRIGKNPQIYSEGDLPKIEGVTSIKGVSTGIVAQEAAKWHSMTAALSMQSQEEIALLKREVASTGAITTELSTSYQALLPQMTNITSMAAQEAKLIVGELQAGKLTVDQARAKIMTLNAQIEAMMAETTAAVAASQGRVANVTSVPLTGQPVVDTTTGKTNMKEMFHKSKTSSLVDKIARALGVRTSGGGYSTHTTIPKKFSGGDIVPGTGNMDTVPALLTPGEFVVNKQATAENLPLLQAINGPGARGPKLNLGSNGPIDGGWEPKTSGLTGEEVSKILPNFKGNPNRLYTLKGTSGLYIGDVTDPEIVEKFGDAQQKRAGKISRQSINLKMRNSSISGRVLAAAIKSSGSPNRGSTEQFLNALANNGIITAAEAKQTSDLIYNRYLEKISSGVRVSDSNNNYWTLANAGIRRTLGTNPEVSYLWEQFSQNIGAHTGDTTAKAGKSGASTSALKQVLTTTDGRKIDVGKLSGTNNALFAHAAHSDPMVQKFKKAGLGSFKIGSRLPRGTYTPGAYKGFNPIRRNSGGIVGYNSGGMVSGTPIRKYGMGGMVLQGMLGMAGAQVAGNAGANIGGKLAGETGSLVGSIAGSSLGFALPTMIQSLVKGGGLRAAIAGISAINPAVAAATVAIGSLYIAYKKHNEQLKLTALGYNLTEDAVTKAGGKYTDLSAALKTAIQDSKDLIEKNRLVYESIASSGTPLKMTVEEYKKLKAEVKSTMPELVKLVNATKTKDLSDLGERLKSQFITAGMSAEDATKKIYTLISLSNKSDLAGKTISSSGFKRVTDPTSAAVSSIKQLNKTISAKDTADQTISAIKAINNAIDQGIKKGEDFSTASAKVIASINQQVGSQKTLSSSAIVKLGSQVPELKGILNLTDTGTSAWAKYQLMIQGVTKDLDTMSGAAALALQKANAAIEKAVRVTLTGKGGSLYSQNEQLKKYNTQIEALKKQANGASVQSQINTKEEIKSINKKIDAINKEYDARKKALSLQQQTEDANIAIQKAQLDYQNALASGDMASAAQAQLNLRGVVGQRQNQLAQDALENARQAKLKPLEDRKNALSEAQDKIANSASLASEKLSALEKSAQDLRDAIDAIVSAKSNIISGLQQDPNYLNTKEGKIALGAYYQTEVINNPNNPNLKNINKYTGSSPHMGKGMEPKNPIALGRQLWNMEQRKEPIDLGSSATQALKQFNSLPKVSSGSFSTTPQLTSGFSRDGKIMAPAWDYSILNSYKTNTAKNSGKTFGSIPGVLSAPKYNIPKTSFNNSSVRTETATAGSATYNMNFVVNGSNMNPEDLWQYMQNKTKALNSKSGIGRSK